VVRCLQGSIGFIRVVGGCLNNVKGEKCVKAKLLWGLILLWGSEKVPVGAEITFPLLSPLEIHPDPNAHASTYEDIARGSRDYRGEV